MSPVVGLFFPLLQGFLFLKLSRLDLHVPLPSQLSIWYTCDSTMANLTSPRDLRMASERHTAMTCLWR